MPQRCLRDSRGSEYRPPIPTSLPDPSEKLHFQPAGAAGFSGTVGTHQSSAAQLGPARHKGKTEAFDNFRIG